MAERKVHGSVFSTATMRVLSCLHEKDLPFDFVAVDMKSGAHKKKDFLAMNPFGQVPVMEDGDLAIFESRAITQHIAQEYQSQGTQLVFPGDRAKMTTQAIWKEVESQQFDQPASKLAFEHVYKPFLGVGTADEAVVAEHQEKLRKVLDVYESRLAKNEYLGGENFGLADLHHQPVLHYLVGTPVKKLFDERPNVSKWVGAILGRPAWEKVVAMQKTQ